jgi:HAD superfamily hydrolase (TIGR01549 family)
MLKAVVLDLDGTITEPFLNFKELRLEMGVPLDRTSLLDLIAAMPEPRRTEANHILEKREALAADNAEFNRGARELLAFVQSRGLHSAVFTRNSGLSTAKVIAKLGIEVNEVITRNSPFPPKPDPAALLDLIRAWQIGPEEVLMVGDYLYDVQAGKAAGTLTCLVKNGRKPEYEAGAEFEVEWPGEVIGVIERML